MIALRLPERSNSMSMTRTTRPYARRFRQWQRTPRHLGCRVHHYLDVETSKRTICASQIQA